MMPGDKRFVTKEFCKQIESPRLSFAPEDFMQEYLDITPGSVSVMGLLNDKEHHVQLVIDKDVLKEEYFGCHPCVNTASVKLKTTDVFGTILKTIQHEMMVVKL